MPKSKVLESSIAVPSDYIPVSYDDLYRTFGPYVTGLVRHYNKVPSNYDDLLSHVWVQLLQKKVLQKYLSSIEIPVDSLTTSQVCSYLGLTWFEFKRMQSAYHGVPFLPASRSSSVALRQKVYSLDHGICRCCGRDAERLGLVLKQGQLSPQEFQLKTGGWVANDIFDLLGVARNQKLFWFIDRPEHKREVEQDLRGSTVCILCWGKHRPTEDSTGEGLTPISGDWRSRRALYDKGDVEGLYQERLARGKLGHPEGKILTPQRTQFKPYLARTIHNIYANWCRTRNRRYKETYPGFDINTGRGWEDTLVDTYRASQDTVVELLEVSRNLAGGTYGDDYLDLQDRVLVLASEGRDSSEIQLRLRA